MNNTSEVVNNTSEVVKNVKDLASSDRAEVLKNYSEARGTSVANAYDKMRGRSSFRLCEIQTLKKCYEDYLAQFINEAI